MLFIFSAIVLITAPQIVPRKARAACLRAEEVNPEIMHDAVIRFGRALAHKNVKELDRLLLDYPWFAAAHRATAEIEQERGAPLAAYAAYKRYVLFEIDDRDEVEKAMHALESQELSLMSYAQAEELARAGSWLDAITALKMVNQSLSVAHRLRGIAHAALGEKEPSAKAYALYLKLEPLAVDQDEVRMILSAVQ